MKSSEAFEVQFPREDGGKLLPASVQFELQAPGFHPPKQAQQVRIKPKADSPVCVFMLTPQREGRLALVLNVLTDGQLVASRRLVTTAEGKSGSAPIEVPTPYKVIEMPLRTEGRPNRLSEDTGSYRIPGGSSAPTELAKIDTPQAPELGRTASPAPAMPRQTGPELPPPPHHAGAPAGKTKKTRKLPWIAVGAAAAAFALIMPSVLVNRASKPPTSVPPADVASTTKLNETIAALSRQIEQNPTSTELYLKRAAAFKRTNNLTAASKDVDKAIQLAPNNPTAKRLRTAIIQEQDRTRAATQAIPR